jgi:uncharacterized protein
MDLILPVKVVPGSSRDRVAGRYGEGVKVQVSAPPERGKANEAVAEVLRDWLGLGRNQVVLISGHGNPRKTFRLSGLSESDLRTKLESLQ